jgi:hypothetical protein
MASLTLERLKPETFRVGTTMGVLTELFSEAATLTLGPTISTFFSISTRD